jgi:hypothetical protein
MRRGGKKPPAIVSPPWGGVKLFFVFLVIFPFAAPARKGKKDPRGGGIEPFT